MGSKNITIGIKIQADGKELTGVAKLSRKELDQISKSAKRTSKSVKGVAASFGLYKKALVVGAAVAFTHELNKQAEALDKIGKTASKVGLTTDELQEMRFAGEQSGVTVTNLDLSMQRFSRRLGEAAKGQGELRGTLDQYNISAVDSAGKTRRNIDVLGDLADAIKNADSEQERLRIAFKSFDSEGAALVNTLKNGKAGLDEYRASAHQYNQVVGAESINSAVEFNDAIGKLTGSFTTFRQEAITPLLPLLTQFFDFLNGDVGTSELDDRTASIAGQIAAIEDELSRFRLLRINPFASDADLKSDKQALLDELDVIQRRIFTFNLRNAKAKETPEAVSPSVDGRSIKALENLDRQLKQQAAVLGLNQEAVLRYRLELGDLSKQVILAGADGDKLKQSILQRAAALDNLKAKQEASKKTEAARLALIREGATLTQSLLTPLEQLSVTEAKLNALRNKGIISQQTLNRAVGAAHAMYQESNTDLIEAREIYEATLTPLEQYAKQIERLNALRDAGAFDAAGGQETYRRAVEQAKDGLTELNVETNEFAKEAARNIQDTFADFLFDPFSNGLEGMAIGFSDVLRRMAADALAVNLNQALLGDVATTGEVGGLLGQGLGAIGIGSAGQATADVNGAGGADGGAKSIVDAIVGTGTDGTVKTILQSASDSLIGATATQVAGLTTQGAIALQTTSLVAAMAANTTAIVGAVSAGGASSLAAPELSGVFSGFLPTFHTGGISNKEQLAVLLKSEEVLTTGDPRHKDNQNTAQQSQGGGTRIINVIDPSIVKDYMNSSSGEKVIMNIIQNNAGQVKQVLA